MAGSVEVVPAVSSVQVAFARLGLDWADARILSAHGRTPSDHGAMNLAEADKIAILAGTKEAIRWSAGMAAALEASHAAFLGENLTSTTSDSSRSRPNNWPRSTPRRSRSCS